MPPPGRSRRKCGRYIPARGIEGPASRQPPGPNAGVRMSPNPNPTTEGAPDLGNRPIVVGDALISDRAGRSSRPLRDRRVGRFGEGRTRVKDRGRTSLPLPLPEGWAFLRQRNRSRPRAGSGSSKEAHRALRWSHEPTALPCGNGVCPGPRPTGGRRRPRATRVRRHSPSRASSFPGGKPHSGDQALVGVRLRRTPPTAMRTLPATPNAAVSMSPTSG